MNVIPRIPRSSQPMLVAAGLLIACTAVADPPERVARVAYLAGEASFAPAGEDTWYAAQLNRPLVAGDQLWTNRDSRLELDMGGVVLRLDEGSHFELLSLNDQFMQAQFTEGSLNLRIDHVHAEQVYEIATPTLAFVVAYPGEFRLDVDGNSGLTRVTVFDGHATVYGEDGENLALRAGASYHFHTPGQLAHQHGPLPGQDDFDRWAFARNRSYVDSASLQYVSSEMIGYADLDRHGSWRHMSDYGHVWFPRRVVAGWAPYRHGHWAWIDPWGWTWVDDAPWGFAPFHYGRWVYVANGWGWVPGPRHLRPVYAPALVAFVGGAGWSLTVSSAGPPVGWFPLGPRDVYMPWYRSSRSHFGRVNVHNTYVFNNVYVTNIYNDYYVQGRPLRRDYTFRGAANAVTVVPRDAFAGGRRAADNMARLRPGVIDRGEILARAPATPTRASLTGGQDRQSAAPPARALSRSVVARSEPPARPASFEARERAIARNGGEPLAQDQMRRLSAARGTDSRAVRVIGRDPAAPTATTAATAATAAAREPQSTRTVRPAATSRAISAPARAPAPTTERSLPSTRYSARGEASHRGVRSDSGSTPPARSAVPTRGSSAPARESSQSTGIPLPSRAPPVAPVVDRRGPASRNPATPPNVRESTPAASARSPSVIRPATSRGTAPAARPQSAPQTQPPASAPPIPAQRRSESPAPVAPRSAPVIRSERPIRQTDESAPRHVPMPARQADPRETTRPVPAERGDRGNARRGRND